MTCPNNNRIYNIGFRSSDPIEKILSNLAHTPFKIEINNQIISCQSVEGFWQGLKLEGKEREKTFQLYGFPAKFAGKGIKRERFEICGLEIETGSIKHRMLIHNAVYEKVVQNKLVYNALIETKGQLVHNVPGKPIFKIEEILKEIYNQFAWSSILTEKVLH